MSKMFPSPSAITSHPKDETQIPHHYFPNSHSIDLPPLFAPLTFFPLETYPISRDKIIP
jgi:hypothetical protein